LRELKEECGLDGTIVKKLTELFKSDGSTEYVFEVDVPEHQSPIVGSDPEEPSNNQPIKDVCWMELNQLSEKDQAFMWSYGLMEIDGFHDEILSWGDSISYPSND
jgi:8-oxo-dGTP pyrophosphatase MutT (NUDIX family)